MRIPEDILEQIKEDPLAGTIGVCTFTLKSMSDGQGWNDYDEELLLETYALITSLQEAKQITPSVNSPSIENAGQHSTCVVLHHFVKQVREQLEETLRTQTNQRKLEHFRNHYSLTLTNSFSYEFTDGDLKRIRTLINELRELITENTELDEDHKRRLLKRLEKMQSEIHKKVSDLNAFYGLAVEASVVLKKVGENAKPIVDRIKELTGISWNTQARAENLPSGTEPPMLENDSTPKSIE
ncbi:hypothetical protein [Pseudomonas brenneri]